MDSKHTPGRRLYDACFKAFDYDNPWSVGTAGTKAKYEAAARAFAQSDPLLAAAPELLEALTALVGLAKVRGGRLHEYGAAVAAAEAVIAKAESPAQ